MHFLLLVALIVLCIYFPRGVKYLIAAPLVGLALGGVAWSINAMVWPQLITSEAFGSFIVGGIVICEIAAAMSDLE